MRKFVFLNPPLPLEDRSSTLAAAAARGVPYGMISLASVIRNHGYEVSLLDATNAGYDFDETVRRLLAEDPAYVGISTVTLSVDNSAKVAAMLKRQRDSVTVLVGGAHLSSAPHETMERFPAFDVGVIGEAEETIVELLSALDRGNSLAPVRGIIFREGAKITKTARRPFIENLDALPMPSWDILRDLVKFYRPSAPSYIRSPSTTIVTSRGCNGVCTFCNSRALHGGLRYFSAGYVLEMMQHLIDTYGVRDLSIYDDNFLNDRDRVLELCQGIRDRRLDLTWSCYSRVDQGDLGLFREMKAAGCWQVSYGIESGSQRILDFIRKNVTLQQIESTVAHTKRAGLRTRGFFMMGHPTETTQSIEQTIRFMKRIALDDFHFTYFTPLPGTPVYRKADDHGTFDRTWSAANMQHPVFVPKDVTVAEMEQLSKYAYRSFYFRPRILAGYLMMLGRHPHNFKRLYHGGVALLSRIFLPHLRGDGRES